MEDPGLEDSGVEDPGLILLMAEDSKFPLEAEKIGVEELMEMIANDGCREEVVPSSDRKRKASADDSGEVVPFLKRTRKRKAFLKALYQLQDDEEDHGLFSTPQSQLAEHLPETPSLDHCYSRVPSHLDSRPEEVDEKFWEKPAVCQIYPHLEGERCDREKNVSGERMMTVGGEENRVDMNEGKERDSVGFVGVNPQSDSIQAMPPNLDNTMRNTMEQMEVKIRTLQLLHQEDNLREGLMRDMLTKNLDLQTAALADEKKARERMEMKMTNLTIELEIEKSLVEYLKKQLESQTSALGQLNQKKNDQNKEILALEIKLEEEKVQKIHFKNNLDLQISATEQLQAVKDDQDKEIEGLLVSLEEETIDKIEMKNKLELQKSTLEQLQREKDDKEDEIKELSLLLENKEEENKELLSKLDGEKAENEQLKAKLAAMEEQTMRNLGGLKRTEGLLEDMLQRYVSTKVN